MSGRTTMIEVPIRWSDMDAYGHVNNVYGRVLSVNNVRSVAQGRVQACRDEAGIAAAWLRS